MKRRIMSSTSELFMLAGMMIIFISGCSKEQDELNNPGGIITTDELIAVVSQNEDLYVPNEVLVKFKAGISSSARKVALARVNGTVAEKILTHAMKHAGDNEGITLVNTPLTAMEAISRLKGTAGVEFAEPNYIYTHDATSNDTYYISGALWGMYGDETTPANEYGCQAGEAWANGNTGSAEIYVGIIDEGYMYEHIELAPNAGTNPGEIPANGVDDDGNGYIDDVYGWDFNGNDNTVFDGRDDDHGTHVAGTIGAVGGNGIGVAGVCWTVKLMDAKFLGKKGGTTANAIKAVDYFIDLKTRHNLNLVALNNSWGGGYYSEALTEAIERANDAGILFIAAAGNSGINTDNSPHYPASYANVNIISVASITSTGALSDFSNYGAVTVDLGAPGSSILSCVPYFLKGNIVSGLAYYSGTSMSTPHVTGAVALYAASHPNASAMKIKDVILKSVIPTGSLSGKCVTGGRLDVSRF